MTRTVAAQPAPAQTAEDGTGWLALAQPLADRLEELEQEYLAIAGSIAGLVLLPHEAEELRRAAAQLQEVRHRFLARELSPREAGGWASAAIRHTQAVRALIA